MMHRQNELVKYVRSLGFGDPGFAKLRKLDEEAQLLKEWLNRSYQGEMSYLERYFDFRIDPQKLVPGAKSVIVLSMGYDRELAEAPQAHPKISRYASGIDYHKVIRKKLKQLIKWLKEHYQNEVSRAFVDSGPVLERVWARESGLSWTGKNTLSIHPKSGSYFFLACLFTDIEFEYGTPIPDFCGTCRRCIEACPTQAIQPGGYVLDASKCISYLTIELKNKIPDAFKGNMADWIFGCDICQEVCPWNRFSKKSSVPEFEPLNNMYELNFEDWLKMTEEEFNTNFKDSPLKRKGLEGIQRTIAFILGS